MSEEKPRHPLDKEPRKGHPTDDDPAPRPPTQRPQGVAVQLPGAVKTPYVTYTLVAINVLIFLFLTVAPEQAYPLFNQTYIAPDAIIQNKELYRLVTGMFLHLQMAHLAFNMLALYYIGGNVERIFGHLRFALIYFLGGLLGSILMLFTGTNGIGASGAVFAIWGAETVFLYLHRDLFGAMARMRLRNSFVMMLFNFLFGLSVNTLGDTTGAGTIRIANEAHLGGLIGGVILTWFIGPRFLAERLTNPAPGQQFIRVLQTISLKERVKHILFFCCGLAGLILLAMLL